MVSESSEALKDLKVSILEKVLKLAMNTRMFIAKVLGAVDNIISRLMTSLLELEEV